MKNILVNRTYQALNYLYLNCRDVQKLETVRSSRIQQPLSHAKEFGTIKLTTARGSGHTRAIAQFICKHKMSFAVILPNLKMSQYLCEKIYEYATKVESELVKYAPSVCKAVNINGFDTYLMSKGNFDNQLRGISVDAIICDVSCFLSSKDIDNIYQIGMACMIHKPFVYFMFME